MFDNSCPVINTGGYPLPNKRNNKLIHRFFGGIFSFEMAFVLFLFAGRFKADPRFSWVPVDLTAFFFGTSIVVGFYLLITRKVLLRVKSFPFVTLGMAFFSYCLLSLIWSPGIIYAGQKAMYVFVLTGWVFLGFSIIIANNKTRLLRFFWIVASFSVWVVVETFLVFLHSDPNESIFALGGNYLGLGRTIGIGALIYFALSLFYPANQRRKIFFFCVFLIHMWILTVLGGRGPLIATILPIMSLFFLWGLKYLLLLKQKISLKNFFFLIASFIVVFLLVFYMFYSGKIPQTFVRLGFLFSGDFGSSVYLRMNWYVSSLMGWMDSPIFGHGIGSWPIIFLGEDVPGYPHNIILEILFEEGLTGFILFITLLFASVIKVFSINIVKYRFESILILLLILNLFINAFLSGDISDNRHLFGVLGLATYRDGIYK